MNTWGDLDSIHLNSLLEFNSDGILIVVKGTRICEMLCSLFHHIYSNEFRWTIRCLLGTFRSMPISHRNKGIAIFRWKRRCKVDISFDTVVISVATTAVTTTAWIAAGDAAITAIDFSLHSLLPLLFLLYSFSKILSCATTDLWDEWNVHFRSFTPCTQMITIPLWLAAFSDAVISALHLAMKRSK